MQSSLAVDSCPIKVEPIGCYRDERNNRALPDYVSKLKCIFTVASSFAANEMAFSRLLGRSLSVHHILETMLDIQHYFAL